MRAAVEALWAAHPDYVPATVDFNRRKICRHVESAVPVTICGLQPGVEYLIRWPCTNEIGGGNSNAHAHGGYSGLYLQQKWLFDTWQKICRDGSFVISIKRGTASYQRDGRFGNDPECATLRSAKLNGVLQWSLYRMDSEIGEGELFVG